MVQQLYEELSVLRAEIRRLKGRLDRISIGGVIIPAHVTGTAQVPTAIDGSIIRGNATPAWERLVRSIPSADVRNVLALDSSDLRPSWKAGLDAVNPTTAAYGDTPSPGTSLIFSHRDHRHGMPDGAGGRFYIPFGSGQETFTP